MSQRLVAIMTLLSLSLFGCSTNTGQPLLFEENVGQTDPTVRFLLKNKEETVFFTEQEIVYKTTHPDKEPSVLRKKFRGASPHPDLSATNRQKTKFTYINEGTNEKNTTDTYTTIHYQRILPGIKILFSVENNTLETHYLLKSAASLKDLEVHLTESVHLSLSEKGDLVIDSENHQRTLPKPTARQNKEKIPAFYIIHTKNTFGFNVEAKNQDTTISISY